jgi:transposase
MSKEKRPQDWSLEEKLKLTIACGPLDDEAVNALSREQSIYPHHIMQWTQDFVGGARAKAIAPSGTKNPKHENNVSRIQIRSASIFKLQ